MGKMPFAGFIGACSLGMMLTGCNCCDKQNQGTRSTYAGGLADKGMGITKPKRANSASTDLASKAGDYVMPPSYAGSPAAANSLASSSGGGSAGTYRTAAAPPGSYGNMPSTSGNASLPPSIGSGMTASANQTIPGGMASSMSNTSPTSLSASGAGNNRLPSSPIQPPPIQQVSGLMSSSPGVKTAAFSSAGGDPSLPLPVKGANDVMIPPPPNTLNASIPPPSGKASSSTTKSTASTNLTTNNTTSANLNSSPAPSILPLPPSSSSGALSTPSQPGAAGSTSIAPNSGTTTPTSSSSPSMGAMPSYLNR
jgi:hypothetical protein